MTNASEAVRLPLGEETIPPVRILDADGRVLRVMSADDFRREHPTVAATPGSAAARRRRPCAA